MNVIKYSLFRHHLVFSQEMMFVSLWETLFESSWETVLAHQVKLQLTLPPEPLPLQLALPSYSSQPVQQLVQPGCHEQIVHMP